MSHSAEIIVAPVDRSQMGEVWPYAVAYLWKGLTAAPDIRMADVLLGLADDDDRLWIVLQAGWIRAAFLTATFVDDATQVPFLGVYGLGGSRVKAWADAVNHAVEDEAKRLNLAFVRFCGRTAWKRLLPQYQAIAERQGATVFERAVR